MVCFLDRRLARGLNRDVGMSPHGAVAAVDCGKDLVELRAQLLVMDGLASDG